MAGLTSLQCQISIASLQSPLDTRSKSTGLKSSLFPKLRKVTGSVVYNKTTSLRTATSSQAQSAVATASSKLKPGDTLPAGYDQDWPVNAQRRAGILLHPTSLPGNHGIGDLGAEAYKFIDWLSTTGCNVWQVLPLVPPGRKSGEDGSPYAGSNANCGNTLLISLEELVKDGLLEASDIPSSVPLARCDFEAVAKIKDPVILKAAQNLLKGNGKLKEEMEKFRKSPLISGWLEDAALFAAIDDSIDAEFWWQWPKDLRDRDAGALKKARKQFAGYIDEFVAQQFLFQRQWQKLHAYANSQGIRVMGDMPIYVGGHSADVWANRKSFMVDEKTGAPVEVSGVPPDAFSATGQLWGSPLYNWKQMARDNYSWWAMRMRRAFELYDEFRIDHFRGLAGYWAIDAEETTAMNGSWKMGPREDFFKSIQKAVGKVDIVAEDLGVITADVTSLRKAIDAPGMAILLFAFGGGPNNPHLPHNHEQNQVVYPGTHDNDTVLGWWQKASDKEKEKVKKYFRLSEIPDSEISWELIRASIASPALTAIFSMQDVLALDNSARMNTPAVKAGNWGWRVGENGFFEKATEPAARMRALLHDFNRLPPPPPKSPPTIPQNGSAK